MRATGRLTPAKLLVPSTRPCCGSAQAGHQALGGAQLQSRQVRAVDRPADDGSQLSDAEIPTPLTKQAQELAVPVRGRLPGDRAERDRLRRTEARRAPHELRGPTGICCLHHQLALGVHAWQCQLAASAPWAWPSRRLSGVGRQGGRKVGRTVQVRRIDSLAASGNRLASKLADTRRQLVSSDGRSSGGELPQQRA